MLLIIVAPIVLLLVTLRADIIGEIPKSDSRYLKEGKTDESLSLE